MSRSAKRRAAVKAGYRSNFEKEIAEALEKDGGKFEYEPKEGIIEWIPKPKKYLPDFVLSNGIIVEAKGRLTVFDRVKHLMIKAQYPKLDIRFVFQFDNKLHKGSKTRYSEWCEKNGFPYAFKKVPKAWIAEKR